MANKRMVSKTISTSVKISRVSDFAALLYTWLITHCDDGGNMEGEAMAIKGRVVPMRDVTVAQVEAALEELELNKLILFYESNNGELELEKFVHIIKWENFQILRADRIDSRFPLYVNQTATRRQPDAYHPRPQDKIREGKRREEKIGKDKTTKAVAKTKTKSTEPTAIQEIVAWYFALKGWKDKKEINKIYARHVRTAKDLFEICEEKVSYAKDRIERVAVWAGSRDLDWTLETVIKKFLDIDKLVPKEKKPTWKGNPMYQRGGKWWVVMPNGEHLHFTNKKSEIIYV